ncbi:thymidylate synthase [Vibrio coralliirubri]|uniref:thymidylate synthase n=1 Tax=Vibrio coralliirubri TaxID=1516159 RepID=UPI00228355F3|nr:thymidylate synthase [Vibrio coralliirubri]MCY9866102.1 thymidylate synthase [Vibrio coralliirubri]
MNTQDKKLPTAFYGRTYRGEAGYRELMKNILEQGTTLGDRTDVGRKKLFSQKLIFDLQDGFPFHSSRSCPFSFAFKEYQAFLSGRSDIHNILSKDGINFWEGNTSREFLDNVGLKDVEVGNMCKAYGFQLRHYNGQFDVETQQAVVGSGLDQIQNAFNDLKTNPLGSRHYVSMWNPVQLEEMALPPCWHSHQWLVIEQDGEKYLNLEVTARSADLLFGTPFNTQQYAYLLLAFSQALNMKPAMLSCELVDCHIYTNQIKYCEELLTREYSEERCELIIKKDISSVNDIVSLTMEDLEMAIPENYVNRTKFSTPRPSMAV